MSDFTNDFNIELTPGKCPFWHYDYQFERYERQLDDYYDLKDDHYDPDWWSVSLNDIKNFDPGQLSKEECVMRGRYCCYDDVYKTFHMDIENDQSDLEERVMILLKSYSRDDNYDIYGILAAKMLDFQEIVNLFAKQRWIPREGTFWKYDLTIMEHLSKFYDCDTTDISGIRDCIKNSDIDFLKDIKISDKLKQKHCNRISRRYREFAIKLCQNTGLLKQIYHETDKREIKLLIVSHPFIKDQKMFRDRLKGGYPDYKDEFDEILWVACQRLEDKDYLKRLLLDNDVKNSAINISCYLKLFDSLSSDEISKLKDYDDLKEIIKISLGFYEN